jgi:hypothetical protein
MLVPDRLREALAGGKLVPFIGAGFSAPSGAPTWRELMESLLEISSPISNRDSLNDRLKLPDLAEVADSLTVTRHGTLQLFAERIDDPRYEPSTYHELLRKIGARTIVTTNWDRLIEDHVRNSGTHVHTIYRDHDVPLYDPLRHVNVIKLHGTISDLESLVYRKSDYERFWEAHPVLFSLLVALLSTNSGLFLGYGFGDPNVLALLDRLAQYLGSVRREHWALSYGQPELERLWERLGVEVIPADRLGLPDHTVATTRFLEELIDTGGSASLNNLERARLVNREIRAAIRRRRPRAVLRMRGALGWLSNPRPVRLDPVYGSFEQDATEREMTVLVKRFLEQNDTHRVRCLLNVNVGGLVGLYGVGHLIRRLKVLRTMIRCWPLQIEVAHTGETTPFNHMLFDEEASLLGFKVAGVLGIHRAVLTRERSAVVAEVEQFDADFWSTIARQMGQSATNESERQRAVRWSRAHVLNLIAEELNRLRLLANTPPWEGGMFKDRIVGSTLATGFVDAVGFCIEKHSAQRREDGTTPYWIHPLRVVERLRSAAGVSDYETLIAAALHDVVEDCDVEVGEIAELFGERTAELVETLTKRQEQTDSEYFDQLAGASPAAAAIKLADRWDNVWELRVKRYPDFGGKPNAQYLNESETVLAACATGNEGLARLLRVELDAAWKELEPA